jgi:hypothetical protein
MSVRLPDPRPLLPEVLCLGGVALLVAGLWLVHPAAALIAGGGFAVAFGVTLRRMQARRTRS